MKEVVDHVEAIDNYTPAAMLLRITENSPDSISEIP